MSKKNVDILEGQFSEPQAGKLVLMRDIARDKRRLIYDCYNAAVEYDKVTCKFKKLQRYPLGFPLISCLRGATPLVCQDCEHYDDGGDPGYPEG